MPVTIKGMSAAKRLNLLLAGTHLLHRHVRPRNMPLHLQFELTNYCNLRCPVCPTGTKDLDRAPIPMSPALFERAWDETAPFLLTASLWGWGEPLLHPRLDQILTIARRHDVATLLSTNGMPLNQPSVREALIESPPTTLIVAIDGITDETNSRYRVGARLEPILSGIRQLADLKRRRKAKYPVLQLRYIVMRHNEHEVDHLEAFARRHEFELLTLRSISLFDITDAETVQGSFVPLKEALQPYQYREGQRRKRPGFICTMPFWFPSIQADGGVVCCEQDHSGTHRFGRLDESTSFRSIWFSEQAARVRRLVRDEREQLSFCRNCPYADRTTTDCSLESRALVPDAVSPGFVVGGSSRVAAQR